MVQNNFIGSNRGSFGTSTNWSLGHVPTSAEDAEIDINSDPIPTFIGSTSNETVNSIALGDDDDILIIEANSTFVSEAGTGPNINYGTLSVVDAHLWLAEGTFDNAGSGLVELNGTNAGNQAALLIGGATTVNLTGAGGIQMAIGGPATSNLIVDNPTSAEFGNIGSIDNKTETISGTGTIGGDLNFTNGTFGSIVTNNDTSSSGGTLVIEGSAAGGSFVNDGNLVAQNGGTVIFGEDGQNSTITNNAAIELDTSGDPTTVEISGDTLVTSSSAGSITLGGSSAFEDAVTSDGHPATLTLVNQTLKGAGTVGDSNLTLDNQSGTVDADVDNQDEALTLDTGSNTITNGGTLEATDGGTLEIESPVNNVGTIAVSGIGAAVVVTATAPVSGAGQIDVGTDGSLFVEAPIAGNIALTGTDVELFAGSGNLIGSVAGVVPSDTFTFINLAGINTAGIHAVWQENAGDAGGTLSLYRNGTALAAVNLTGQFNSLDFAVRNGLFGVVATVQSAPIYEENPGNNDEWILSDGSWVESAGPGSHPSGYNVALIGDWTGDSTDGILWFNPTTGDTDEWQLSNTQWSGTVDLGTHPTNATDGNSFQIAGTDQATHFFGNGIDDVLWTSVNSDGTIATDIWQLSSSGQWTPTPGGSSPGVHPAGYTIAGTGDWTGDGTDGILWFNSTTGDTDEWQLSDGQWAGSVDLGAHPANSNGNSFQIAGIGDFFDNGRDGVLWTSVNSDGSIATDIWELDSTGHWMQSQSPGNHPAGYEVVAVGDFTGTGTSDILWYNASIGDTDEWLINNGQYAGHIDLGPHTPSNGWNVAGVGDFNGAGNASILWHSPS